MSLNFNLTYIYHFILPLSFLLISVNCLLTIACTTTHALIINLLIIESSFNQSINRSIKMRTKNHLHRHKRMNKTTN